MNVHEALAEFDRRHGIQKTHKKLVGLDVVETSLVDHPAHGGPEGWVVMKSAGAVPVSSSEAAALIKAAPARHDHLADAHYLNEPEQQSASLFGADALKPGESVPISDTASVQRDTCGCLYLVTPESVQKAADADFAQQFARAQQEARTQSGDGMLTAQEVAFLLGEKPAA